MIARRTAAGRVAVAGLSRWAAPVAVSLAVHAAIAGGVLLWDRGAVPPKPPAFLAVELVMLAETPGAKEIAAHGAPGRAGARQAAAAKPAESPPGERPRTEQPDPAPIAPPTAKPPTPVPVPAPHRPARTIKAAAPETPPEPVPAIHAPRPKAKPVFHPPPVAKQPPPRIAAAPATEQTAALPAAALLSNDGPAGNAASDAAAGAGAGTSDAPIVPPSFTAPGLANPLPSYPRRARRRGLEGRLVLRVAVDAAGRAGDIRVLETSGHALLDEAAVRAVGRWRFEPGKRAGSPVPASVDVPVVFRLGK